MKPVRYGIIGVGRIATNGHIPALQALEQAEIVAIADVDTEALNSVAKNISNVAAYSDYRELLADPNVEVALIATPNWLHREQAVAALDAGKHVFCEKPLGIDIAECEDIIAAQKRSGKLLQVGHELHYAELFQGAKEKVDSGLIGKIQMMFFHEFRSPLVPGWRQSEKTGGIMLEKNSHFFDLFNWFAESDPIHVTGMGGNNVNHDSPLLDNCVVTVEYRNNIRATLIMCLFSERGSQHTFDIVGDKGRLIAYAGDQRLLHYTRESPEPREWTFDKGADGVFHPGVGAQHKAFIRCIRQGEPVLVDAESAHLTIRVSLAAEKTIQTNTFVEIDGRPT
jgi:myo-inositol 2-dehydrogenase / D-chiro-inositol 1-dehydrogenase